MVELVSTSEHRVISYSSLERSSVIISPILKKFFAENDSLLELWQNNSANRSSFSYHLDIHIPFISSRQVPHLIQKFEKENSGIEAYEKILYTLKNGGKIYLNFISFPVLLDCSMRKINLTSELSLNKFYPGDFLGE
ncbi:MAG: hypothetical protein AABX99_01270 [Nanoarchaeota archaeon]